VTTEQLLEEIRALPEAERERLVQQMRDFAADEIPQDFIDAINDMEKGRVVPLEIALTQPPPTN
jgi:hypothetical protein